LTTEKKKLEANEQESKQIVVVQSQDDSEKATMLSILRNSIGKRRK
jgi:hypothetical protein